VPIPEIAKTHNDLVDIVIESAQKIDEITLPDGTKQKQLVLDPEIIWWKTGIVNSPTYARFAYELKEWERLGVQCFDNMSSDRARQMAHNIIDLGTSYRRSIDAKSSESLRDRENTQSTLIDKINRNKIEKAYTIKGEAKRSIIDGVLGRDAQKDLEEDG